MKTKELQLFIGEKIRNYRLANGMTQADLAEKLQVAKSTISGYEKGYRSPMKNTLFQLADVFNVSIDDFFPPTPSKPASSSAVTDFDPNKTIVHFSSSDPFMRSIWYQNDFQEFIKIVEKATKAPINNEAFTSLKQALNDAFFIEFGIDELFNLYNFNVETNGRIKDLSSLVEYLDEKVNSLIEYLESVQGETELLNLREDISITVFILQDYLERIDVYLDSHPELRNLSKS